MAKNNFRKILVVLALLTVPMISWAQEDPGNDLGGELGGGGQTTQTDKCAQKCALTAGATSTTVAQRQACDQCRLEQDQANLKKIREEEDVKQATEDCKSQYAPKADGQTPVTSGQYVPVNETGQLLSVTQSSNKHLQNIDKFTGQAYDMDVLLCMYLHAVKRVQYAFEDLAFIKEPDMRRQAATKVEQYKQGILGKGGLIQTGYAPSGEQTEAAQNGQSQGGSSLYPKNLEEYQGQAAQEGTINFKNDLNNSDNTFRTQVSAQLTYEHQKQPAFFSTVTTGDYNRFINGTGVYTTDGWGKTFDNVFDINLPNNPFTSYMHSKEQLNREISARQGVALAEYQAGSGYLPVRKCILYNGKTCREWETVTPAQAIAQVASDVLRARLEEYISPEIGQVGSGNEPVTTEARIFQPAIGAGGGDVGGRSYDGNGGYGDNIIDIDITTNPDNDGNGGGGETTDPPVVSIGAANTNVGTRLISWESTNTRTCKAGNDWIGSNDRTTKLVKVIKTRSQSVGKSGTLTSQIPLYFDSSWSKNGAVTTSAGMSTTTNARGTSIKTTWNPPAPAALTDTFTLSIQDGDNTEGYTMTVGGTRNTFEHLGPGEIVRAFANYASNNPNLPVYERYKFTYNDTAPSPNIVIEVKEPEYQIQCTGTNGGSASATTK